MIGPATKNDGTKYNGFLKFFDKPRGRVKGLVEN